MVLLGEGCTGRLASTTPDFRHTDEVSEVR
jgi:hypothetical protein